MFGFGGSRRGGEGGGNELMVMMFYKLHVMIPSKRNTVTFYDSYLNRCITYVKTTNSNLLDEITFYTLNCFIFLYINQRT